MLLQIDNIECSAKTNILDTYARRAGRLLVYDNTSHPYYIYLNKIISDILYVCVEFPGRIICLIKYTERKLY